MNVIEVAHASALLEMNALVAKEDVLVVVRHAVPRIGDPERAEEDGVIAREVDALPAERDEEQQRMNRELELALPLLLDPEFRKLRMNLGHQAGEAV